MKCFDKGIAWVGHALLVCVLATACETPVSVLQETIPFGSSECRYGGTRVTTVDADDRKTSYVSCSAFSCPTFDPFVLDSEACWASTHAYLTSAWAPSLASAFAILEGSGDVLVWDNKIIRKVSASSGATTEFWRIEDIFPGVHNHIGAVLPLGDRIYVRTALDTAISANSTQRFGYLDPSGGYHSIVVAGVPEFGYGESYMTALDANTIYMRKGGGTGVMKVTPSGERVDISLNGDSVLGPIKVDRLRRRLYYSDGTRQIRYVKLDSAGLPVSPVVPLTRFSYPIMNGSGQLGGSIEINEKTGDVYMICVRGGPLPCHEGSVFRFKDGSLFPVLDASITARAISLAGGGDTLYVIDSAGAVRKLFVSP
ncbi:MAG: hypothetical protein JNL01_04095 [Bdellovibrionales bacterium]|nr:hypothetical protein [Bdellovibrionales bacterium]